MICECFGGPLDGGTELLPHETAVGFVHGVMMAHSAEHHPFAQPMPQDLISEHPAVVALYALTRIDHHIGRLDFKGYARHKAA